ncbi:MAG: SRPBCC family protein, partial [Pseudomonadota bacterium]
MPIDVASHLGAVRRTVRALERDGQPARAVILERSYDTDIDDLWDAMTNPGRLPRWFLPVEGDLKRGGRYQLKGNAGGTITDCEPPVHLGLTWEMMGQVSWVEVRLAREAEGRTRFTLTHTAPLSDFWRQYGPGAVGVGWEGGLMGLALYLADPAG